MTACEKVEHNMHIYYNMAYAQDSAVNDRAQHQSERKRRGIYGVYRSKDRSGSFGLLLSDSDSPSELSWTWYAWCARCRLFRPGVSFKGTSFALSVAGLLKSAFVDSSTCRSSAATAGVFEFDIIVGL